MYLGKARCRAPSESRKASTFTGFCRHHDSELFVRSKRLHSNPCSREHVFLLMYRALCMELHAKRRALRACADCSRGNSGRDHFTQRQIHMELDGWEHGLRLAIRELEARKKQFDEMLRRHDFSDVNALVVEFVQDRPDIVCSSGLLPECDFAGRQLQISVSSSAPWMISSPS